MVRLRDVITPKIGYKRSINIERDLDLAATLSGYIPTARATDTIERLARSLSDLERPRAWSITGPYGSGKSSVANFIAALLGPNEGLGYRSATRNLRAANAALARQLQRGRRDLDAEPRGFVRAVATGRREPISATVSRALYRGVKEFWAGPGRKPRVLHELEKTAGGHPLPEEELLEHLCWVAEREPLLLVIDEMGKNLEYAAEGRSDGDFFVLQQISETVASSSDRAGFVLVLQHLAFEDYALGLSSAQLKEWNKIQGRFEDVPFVDPPEQTVRLIADVFEHHGGAEFSAQLRAWGEAAAHEVGGLQLGKFLPAEKDLFRKTYPLHPLLLACLPDLCSRYGQNDRSLFTFLTGPEPYSVPSFLHLSESGVRKLPVLGLDWAYDYFVESMGSTRSVSSDSSRWLEIQTSVREAGGLVVEEVRCLKTIAMLNLVAGTGPLRASRDVLRFALTGPEGTKSDQDKADALIGRLQSKGVVTYREFADEFRIWKGSDFDVRGAIERERERLAGGSFLHQLMQAFPPRPLVVGRHSQRFHVLRYFERRYIYDLDLSEKPSLQDPTADGLILHVFGRLPDDASVPAATDGGRPVVIVKTPDTARLKDAVLEAAASASLLNSAPELERDKVARGEIAHRASIAREILKRRIEQAFLAGREDVQWFLRGRKRSIRGPLDLAKQLSDLCDKTYKRTPILRNELLNRRELTSQGAKARRELMEAMVLHQGDERLQIQGFGPERSMYEACLAEPGLHGRNQLGRTGFQPPRSGHSLVAAWDAIDEFFTSASGQPKTMDEIYRVLSAPPFGMKEGAIPVLLLAALLHRSDDVAIYQEGTYQPVLSPDLMERLVKIPDRFAVKYFRIDGTRLALFREFSKLLAVKSVPGPVRWRNVTLLSVVRPLMAIIRSLPEYSIRTHRLSAQALKVREVLLTVREPDVLVFEALPRACGQSAFPAADVASAGAVRAFILALAPVLGEIMSAYDDLLDDIRSQLRRGFSTKGPASALREDLRARSRHLVDQVLEPRMRSFLLMALTQELEDREWLEALAMNLTQKPPRTWSDEDAKGFLATLSEVTARFKRLEALYYELRDHRDAHGFEARRVTVTMSDGRESSQVLWTDGAALEALGELVNDSLKRSNTILGQRGPETFLAILADEIMLHESPDEAVDADAEGA